MLRRTWSNVISLRWAAILSAVSLAVMLGDAILFRRAGISILPQDHRAIFYAIGFIPVMMVFGNLMSRGRQTPRQTADGQFYVREKIGPRIFMTLSIAVMASFWIATWTPAPTNLGAIIFHICAGTAVVWSLTWTWIIRLRWTNDSLWVTTPFLFKKHRSWADLIEIRIDYYGTLLLFSSAKPIRVRRGHAAHDAFIEHAKERLENA